MKIEPRPAYLKGRKKCQKRNWDLDLLDSIVASYADNGGFSDEQIIKYHDHALKGRWKGYREFHPYGKRHNWVVVYHIENDNLVLDAVGDGRILVLDDTGTHDEVFGADDFDKCTS